MSMETLPPRQKQVLSLIVELTDEHGYPPTLAELATAMGLRNRMTVHQHVVALKGKGLVRWEPGLNRSLRVIQSEEVNTSEDDTTGSAAADVARFNAGGNARLSNKDGIKSSINGNAKSGSKNSVMTGAKFGGTKDLQAPLAFPRNDVEADLRPPLGIPLAGTIAAGRPIDAVQTDEYLQVDQRYSDEGCFALKIKGDSMIEDGIFDGDFVIVKPQPSPRNGEIVVATLEDGSATLKRFFKENGRFRLQPANASMAPIYIDGSQALDIQGVVVALFRQM
jgi:SOS-response transcriptional repressor LexA